MAWIITFADIDSVIFQKYVNLMIKYIYPVVLKILNLFRGFFYIWNGLIKPDMISKDKRNGKYHAIKQKKRSMTMKLNSASNWQHTIAKFWLVSNCINLYLIWDEFMPCKLIVQALVVTLLSFNALSSEASGFLFICMYYSMSAGIKFVVFNHYCC